MITGLNHLTIAVTNLERSFDFYMNILDFQPHAKWDKGAYLSLGSLWFCLDVDEVEKRQDYTHFAFTIYDLEIENFRKKLQYFKVLEWKENKSEGASIYFLDPDGHKLEVHVGSLESRLAECKRKPYKDMIFF